MLIGDKIPPDVRRRAMEEEAARRGLQLPAPVRARMYEEEAARRGLLTYPSFKTFVQTRQPELLVHDYMLRQIAVAERVLAGEIRRLLVLLPTQYGKSTIWSRLLPAYYLLKHPGRTVALASYGADLAWEHSGEARDIYASAGGQFREGSPRGATRNWRTARNAGKSGGMWATGIGGPALGRGWHLGVVDDPVDPEQAQRGPYLRRFARWWPAKWLRGQAAEGRGGAAMIFVMQRLGPDDPVSWLLEREGTKAEERWHILVMDEIKSAEPFGRWKGPLGFPPSCTVEPDPRKVGEVLAPKYRDKAEVERMQAQAGSIIAAAQRQQRPMRPTGDFWNLKWFEGRTYETLPPDAHNGGWDLDTAYTKDEANSATAGVKSYRGAGEKNEFRIYIDDLFWEWFELPELLADLRLRQGPFYVEQKASGKSAVQMLKTYGITAQEVPVKGDKLQRASAAQPAVSVGRIYINKLVYDRLLYGEQQGLLRITAEALQEDGEGLDLNDAFVQALFRHLGINSQKRKLQFG